MTLHGCPGCHCGTRRRRRVRGDTSVIRDDVGQSVPGRTKSSDSDVVVHAGFV